MTLQETIRVRTRAQVKIANCLRSNDFQGAIKWQKVSEDAARKAKRLQRIED